MKESKLGVPFCIIKKNNDGVGSLLRNGCHKLFPAWIHVKLNGIKYKFKRTYLFDGENLTKVLIPFNVLLEQKFQEECIYTRNTYDCLHYTTYKYI